MYACMSGVGAYCGMAALVGVGFEICCPANENDFSALPQNP
jgi:hypothetical protein